MDARLKHPGMTDKGNVNSFMKKRGKHETTEGGGKRLLSSPLTFQLFSVFSVVKFLQYSDKKEEAVYGF